MASSRTSVIPTYDDVSLSYRNALLASKSHHPSNSETRRSGDHQSTGKKNERRSSHLSTDSQEKGATVDQPGMFYESVDVVSNIPKSQKQSIPKDQKQPPPKPPRQFTDDANTAVTEEPVYSVLEGPEPDNVSHPPSNDVMPPEMNAPSAILDHGKPSAEVDSTSGTGDRGSPEYAVVDPSPEVPDKAEDQTRYNEYEQRDESPGEEKHRLLHDEKPAADSFADGAAVGSTPEQYLTILPPTPPKQMNEPTSEDRSVLESSGQSNLDQYSVSPKEEPSKSRTVSLEAM